AWERAATDEERAQIASVLDESMTAGAFGFSTSYFDSDAQSRPVPSRLADQAERAALVEVLGRYGRGFVEFIPRIGSAEDPQEMLEFAELCGEHGVVSTINVLVANARDP